MVFVLPEAILQEVLQNTRKVFAKKPNVSLHWSVLSCGRSVNNDSHKKLIQRKCNEMVGGGVCFCMRCLTLSLPESDMETCKVDLTFESVDEIL